MEYFCFIIFASPLLIVRNRYTYWFVVVVATTFLALRGSEDEYSRLLSVSPPLQELLNEPNLLLFSDKGPILALVNGLVLQLHLPAQTIFLYYVPLQIGIFAYVAYRSVRLYNVAFFLAMCQSVLFTSMSGLRMGLTASLTLLMIYCLGRLATSRAFGSLLLSMANHYTAYITPLFFVFLIPRTWAMMLVLILALLTKSSGILDYVFGLFPQDSVVDNYLRSENYTYQLQGLDHLKAVQQFIVCCFVALNFNRIISSNLFDRSLFGCYVLSTAFLIAFSDFAIFAYRLSAVFSLAETLLVAKIVHVYYSRWPIIYMMTICGGVFIAYFNYVILERLQPYHFFVV